MFADDLLGSPLRFAARIARSRGCLIDPTARSFDIDRRTVGRKVSGSLGRGIARLFGDSVRLLGAAAEGVDPPGLTLDSGRRCAGIGRLR